MTDCTRLENAVRQLFAPPFFSPAFSAPGTRACKIGLVIALAKSIPPVSVLILLSIALISENPKRPYLHILIYLIYSGN